MRIPYSSPKTTLLKNVTGWFLSWALIRETAAVAEEIAKITISAVIGKTSKNEKHPPGKRKQVEESKKISKLVGTLCQPSTKGSHQS